MTNVKIFQRIVKILSMVLILLLSVVLVFLFRDLIISLMAPRSWDRAFAVVICVIVIVNTLMGIISFILLMVCTNCLSRSVRTKKNKILAIITFLSGIALSFIYLITVYYCCVLRDSYLRLFESMFLIWLACLVVSIVLLIICKYKIPSIKCDQEEQAAGKYKKKAIAFWCWLLAFLSIVTIVYVSVVYYQTKKNENKKNDNVFDQLYYEVEAVSKGYDSILLTGTDTTYVDFDFGAFMNIQIPDLDMCLDYDNKSLYILFFNHSETEKWNTSFCVLYRYDFQDNTIYGEMPFDYLNDNFLLHYFNWCNNSEETNEYSLQDLGSYTFILQETVNYN